MPSLPVTITYQNLVDSVLASIKANAKNIDNVNNIPNAFKSGYSYTATTTPRYKGSDGSLIGNAVVTMSIQNPISAVPYSTVQSEFNSFLSSSTGLNTS